MLYFSNIVSSEKDYGSTKQIEYNQRVSDTIELIAISLIVFMTVLNLYMVAHLSLHKMIVYIKKRKYKKWLLSHDVSADETAASKKKSK